MQLVVIDMTPAQRAAMIGRVQEACRQAGLQRITVFESDPLNLDGLNWDKTIGCFVGPGTGSMIKELLSKLEAARHDCPFALVVDADTYASEAVAIHRVLDRPVIMETDLPQLATFIIECERRASGKPTGLKQRHIVGVAQLKGGVGATTIACALGSAWAKQERSVCIVDLDDLNSCVTEWARVEPNRRALISDMMRTGDLSIERLRDAITPIPGFEGRLCALGQPIAYHEGFHLKSYVLEGAPSGSDYVTTVLALLSAEFDTVIIDLSKGWGVGVFAALPWCEQIMLVVDCDGLSIKSSLSALARLKNDSGDPEEFNMNKWSVVLNKRKGFRIRERDVRTIARDLELFGDDLTLHSVPLSSSGRLWGAPGETFYEAADRRASWSIQALTKKLLNQSASGGWLRRFVGK